MMPQMRWELQLYDVKKMYISTVVASVIGLWNDIEAVDHFQTYKGMYWQTLDITNTHTQHTHTHTQHTHTHTGLMNGLDMCTSLMTGVYLLLFDADWRVDFAAKYQ